jgi:hypothetical protein
MKSIRTVTFDTGIIVDHKFERIDILDLAKKNSLEIAVVSVTERELNGTLKSIIEVDTIPETIVWDETPWGDGVWAEAVPESFILGESPLGVGVLSDDKTAAAFEFILNTISNGAFPRSGKRDNLSEGERKQLRDAMIFEAHVRSGRDIFVSNDRRAFIGKAHQEKRRALEASFKTQIFDRLEFLVYLGEASSVQST